MSDKEILKMTGKVIYIHGQGGSHSEADHYKSLFYGRNVIGFDYYSETPWEAEKEFGELFDSFCDKNENIILIANSIGAYFAMCSLYDRNIEKAFFISPILDMEKLIKDMMKTENISEEELCLKSIIRTSFGQDLSWEYLKYTRTHHHIWNVPTHIIYGDKDNMTSYDTVSIFADTYNATIDIMKNGEHWFHTEEQMKFIDNVIKKYMR